MKPVMRTVSHTGWALMMFEDWDQAEVQSRLSDTASTEWQSWSSGNIAYEVACVPDLLAQSSKIRAHAIVGTRMRLAVFCKPRR